MSNFHGHDCKYTPPNERHVETYTFEDGCYIAKKHGKWVAVNPNRGELSGFDTPFKAALVLLWSMGIDVKVLTEKQVENIWNIAISNAPSPSTDMTLARAIELGPRVIQKILEKDK